jgi:hypothetical protein
VLGLLVAILALGLSACGGDDEPPFESTDTASETASDQPEAKASNATKSCQAIVGSGAVEDIQAIWDRYKDIDTPFSGPDAKKMRDALDRLAKAGDNAAPKIREDVVVLVADVGSQIDARIKIEGLGKVASPAKIERELDALCRVRFVGGQLRSPSAMMFPSLSLNHAVRVPPSSTMPSTVLMPGRSYSLNWTPLDLRSAMSRSKSSESMPSAVFCAVPANCVS